MYTITSGVDIPDIEGMKLSVEKMMQRGVRVTDINERIAFCNEISGNLSDKLRDRYGIMNPNSPKQVTDYLKSLTNKVGGEQKNEVLEACYDPETNKWTSKEEALTVLQLRGYKFAEDMLKYRKIQSELKTLNTLAKHKDENGLVHPLVSLNKTNRIAYAEPALMNIQKELLWKLIEPYNNGDTIISVDIKNQEPHILIEALDDEKLCNCLKAPEGLYEAEFKLAFEPLTELNILGSFLNESRLYSYEELDANPLIKSDKYNSISFKNSDYALWYNGYKVLRVNRFCYGGDLENVKYPETVTIETENCKFELPVEWRVPEKSRKKDITVYGLIKGLEWHISPLARKQFKTAWLAMSYGCAMRTVVESCTAIDGKTVYNFFASIKAFKEYKNAIRKIAANGSNCIKSFLGTTLYTDKATRAEVERSLMDLPVQGTGADILSLLIKHFNKERDARGYTEKDMFIYYTRHDEVIIEVCKDLMSTPKSSDKVINDIREIFEHRVCALGKTWEPFKFELEVIGAHSKNTEKADEILKNTDTDTLLENCFIEE